MQMTEEPDTLPSERDKLDPPISWGEQLRDSLLRLLDHPFFQILGVLVILLVIIDGAFFFFLLVGWQSMCRPRMDCEPRNWWYNASIQILNVLFTYMAVVSMPWRSTHFLHITGWGCPYRKNTVGHDLYGLPNDEDIWFHIPLRKRLGIVLILLTNSLTQFANQATRIKYYSFEMQNEYPGNVWTNVFFGASFLAAGIAGAWLGYEVHIIRKANPGKFGPGPHEMLCNYYDEHLARYFGERKTKATENSTIERNEEVIRRTSASSYVDPTRDHDKRSILPMDRTSMRMFAM